MSRFASWKTRAGTFLLAEGERLERGRVLSFRGHAHALEHARCVLGHEAEMQALRRLLAALGSGVTVDRLSDHEVLDHVARAIAARRLVVIEPPRRSLTARDGEGASRDDAPASAPREERPELAIDVDVEVAPPLRIRCLVEAAPPLRIDVDVG